MTTRFYRAFRELSEALQECTEQEKQATSAASMSEIAAPVRHVGSDDLLGGLEIVALDQSAECVGCGNEKRYRAKLAESNVCCGECWRRLPHWAKDAFIADTRRPAGGREHGATIWQNRLSILLQWMRDSDSPNAGGQPHPIEHDKTL